MGMVFTDHVTDDTRGFAVGLVGRIAVLAHRVENTTMDRFQTIAHIRQSTRHDHAHGVIEIRALHLIRDGDRANILLVTAGNRLIFIIGQNTKSIS